MRMFRYSLALVAVAVGLANVGSAEPIVDSARPASPAYVRVAQAADTAAFASAPKQFFQAIVAKDYATAWGLLSEKTKKSLVATSAKEAKMSDEEMRKLFDTNDPAIQNGFWSAFRGSCKADVFVGFSYTYGRQVGDKHIVELRRPGAGADKALELEVYDEGGPKFGMAESFKL
jgi:hypothetical protein